MSSWFYHIRREEAIPIFKELGYKIEPLEGSDAMAAVPSPFRVPHHYPKFTRGSEKVPLSPFHLWPGWISSENDAQRPVVEEQNRVRKKFGLTPVEYDSLPVRRRAFC
jgi:hypothetical protein